MSKIPAEEQHITSIVKLLHIYATWSVLPLIEEIRLVHYQDVITLLKALQSTPLVGLNQKQKSCFYAVKSSIESALTDLELFVDEPDAADCVYKDYADSIADICCALRAGIGYWRDKTDW
jgi:hypothetical protein